MPNSVPLVLNVVTAVAVFALRYTSGKLVVPVPAVNGSPENVAAEVDAAPALLEVIPPENPWITLKLLLTLFSAIVPVFAGRLAVTDPKAPVTVLIVTVPEVALPRAMLPT